VIGRILAIGALLALLSACADAVPSRSEASAGESVAVIPLPAPGQPFSADTLLAAMRDSRRPGGVSDEIATGAVAANLADAIWTIDGQPWTTISAGGSCGPQTCTLEFAGAAAGAVGEDLWVFEVTPDSGQVEVVSAELRSLPADLLARLDAATRASLASDELEGLALTNLRWLPPPDETQFVLSYRSGGEEGGPCGMDVTLDAAVPEIVSTAPVGC
jgi:hypothetical protein